MSIEKYFMILKKPGQGGVLVGPLPPKITFLYVYVELDYWYGEYLGKCFEWYESGRKET